MRVYFHDGDRVTIAGTPMRATVVGDESERQRLWMLADRVFAPYAAYRREAAKASRTIPIVRLERRELLKRLAVNPAGRSA